MKVEDKILPDFLVVGAMKAGSTTLMDYLVSHQDVGIPGEEINYFDKDSNYSKGDRWYSTWFKSYASKQIIGEKTPAYCYDPKVAERIFRQNPNMKLVWILRNPVKRTYSNYWHYIRIGKENLSVGDCLKFEKERIKTDIYKGYFKRSIYVEQVECYLEVFPMEQMHFIIFEDFIKDPERGLNNLSNFLGIVPAEFTQKPLVSNKGYKPLSISAEYYARQWFGYGMVHKIVHNLNKWLGAKYTPIDKDLERILYQKFKPHNVELSNLLKKDLSCWDRK
jgi:hypothetical protein